MAAMNSHTTNHKVNRPPLTFPLVAMAEVERPVMPVMKEESRIIAQVRPDVQYGQKQKERKSL